MRAPGRVLCSVYVPEPKSKGAKAKRGYYIHTTYKTALKRPIIRVDLLNGIQEAVGSIPSGSTIKTAMNTAKAVFFLFAPRC